MRVVISVLLGLAPLTCLAQMYGPDYEQCNQDATVDIVDCVDRHAKRWDAELNRAYKALMSRAEESQRAPLKAAQRSWINYRDANCAFYGSASGSVSRIEAAECLRAMTQARACELKSAGLAEAPSDPSCEAAPRIAQASSQDAAPPAARSPAGAQQDEDKAPVQPPATVPPASMAGTLDKRDHTSRGSFFGMYSETDKKKGSYQADLRAYIQFAEPVEAAGGTAVFGWLEASDEVVLLNYAKYLPSLSLAETTRSLALRKPLMDVNALPRYLMQCIWETDEAKVAPALAVYAERDDANSQSKRSKTLDSLIVTWVNIPHARAEKKFAAFDYCAEISRTGQTHAKPFLGVKL